MAIKDVLVPDLGGSDGVDVIELSVQPGDRIEKEDTLLVVESDKATVEVPSPYTGVVKTVVVSIGQSVKEGDKLVEMELDGDESEASSATKKAESEKPSAPAKTGNAEDQNSKLKSSEATTAEKKPSSSSDKKSEAAAASSHQMEVIAIPDIGGGEDVDVIEVNVQEGDQLEPEQTLVVLESDKATMEIPCPKAGTVRKVLLKVGDKVSQGTPALELLVASTGQPAEADSKPATEPASSGSTAISSNEKAQPAEQAARVSGVGEQTLTASKKVHAGPAVRRLARELGVDLAMVKASGPRARILKEDVHAYVNKRLSGKAEAIAEGSGLPKLPEIDFAKWGEVEAVELNKINKLTATNLHRAWVHIPHVTQFDEADITELETFRKAESARLKEEGVKLTLLAFMVKACAKSLQEFPRFNSSLSPDGTHLIFKKYINVGIAVDTPNGLVVPVIKDADKKSVKEIALDMQTLSEKARSKKLSPGDMQGGTFSISSLGGIGGTAFTPIVNWPEVSILGVSRSQMKPVYNGEEFEPRLMVPLSLSYDHRVVDGADAARFTTFLSRQLSDIRRLLF
ncbi:dihydrolipoyllysine-residue acetyltransferase [Ketobacter sp. MCCC 1A13808]|uniref:dihydrolipoyllysine-residue acetyltransferase n=1 Tax=Ketobacter sp. MCCC 1A13808 TaxID=2602738 RepID=UPI00132B7342|nr:dihydrolipoyllysine-residue acetyltransferase [Ketobacter sp. MCCC 1A13808]